ncbi:MAG: hypothetical protein ACR2LQ_13020 [Acidimicrobiales bacterium]
MLTADPDADLEGALVEWRRTRRRKRIADVHWIDALYQAYLTGLIGGIALLAASGAVGDDVLSPSELDRLLVHGHAWIGGLAALAIALGVRSGSRGGPIALERADVRHVLLAPVDRTTAMRAPVLRQLRFLAFVGTIVGGLAGNLAAKRLPGATLAWVSTGALVGLTLVALAIGAALVANGIRLPRWAATTLAVVLVVAAALDGTGVTSFSPTAPFGRLALWPQHFDVVGLIPVIVASSLLGLGVTMVGNVSLEDADRRSTLVGQLRFAATLQDLRTVIVLRRQLAMELPRIRPWVWLKVHGTGRLPVFTRGLRGVLRWPAARVARVVLLAAAAGAALRGAWTGTTPLVLVAGFALFIAGLDAIEPLAQEVDHPSRRDTTPSPAGEIHVRHLPIALVVMVATAALVAGAEAAPGPGQVPIAVAFIGAIALAMGGTGAALVSVISGPAQHSDAWTLLPPETQGMRLAFRTAWPPAVAIIGAAVPLLIARHFAQQGKSPEPGALAAVGGVSVLFVLIAGWVRFRDDIRAFFKAQIDLAIPPKDDTADAKA